MSCSGLVRGCGSMCNEGHDLQKRRNDLMETFLHTKFAGEYENFLLENVSKDNWQCCLQQVSSETWEILSGFLETRVCPRPLAKKKSGEKRKHEYSGSLNKRLRTTFDKQNNNVAQDVTTAQKKLKIFESVIIELGCVNTNLFHDENEEAMSTNSKRVANTAQNGNTCGELVPQRVIHTARKRTGGISLCQPRRIQDQCSNKTAAANPSTPRLPSLSGKTPNNHEVTEVNLNQDGAHASNLDKDECGRPVRLPERIHFCCKCEHSFASMDLLESHKVQEHEPRRRATRTSIFRNQNNSSRRSKHHEEVECKMCKAIVTKPNLKRHMKSKKCKQNRILLTIKVPSDQRLVENVLNCSSSTSNTAGNNSNFTGSGLSDNESQNNSSDCCIIDVVQQRSVTQDNINIIEIEADLSSSHSSNDCSNIDIIEVGQRSSKPQNSSNIKIEGGVAPSLGMNNSDQNVEGGRDISGNDNTSGNNENEWLCEFVDCLYRPVSYRDKLDHLKSHENTTVHKCTLCSTQFLDMRNFVDHFISHQKAAIRGLTQLDIKIQNRPDMFVKSYIYAPTS